MLPMKLLGKKAFAISVHDTQLMLPKKPPKNPQRLGGQNMMAPIFTLKDRSLAREAGQAQAALEH